MAAGALGFSYLLSSWDDTLSGFPLRRLALPCVPLRCACGRVRDEVWATATAQGRTNLRESHAKADFVNRYGAWHHIFI